MAASGVGRERSKVPPPRVTPDDWRHVEEIFLAALEKRATRAPNIWTKSAEESPNSGRRWNLFWHTPAAEPGFLTRW